MGEAKARDILGQLPVRRTPGAGIARRVGRRGWERPNVAVSARIFKLYKLNDPWDPQPTGDDAIELGPVALKLGERRQVARHAKPPRPPKNLGGVRDEKPWEKYKRKGPPPRPKREAKPPSRQAQPAPTRAEGPRPTTSGEFGSPPKHALKGKLPVRPDPPSGVPPRRSRARSRPPPVQAEATRHPLAPLPVRPDAVPETAEAGLPQPCPARPSRARQSARLSLKPTPVTAPIVREVEPARPERPPPEPREPPPPEPRQLPTTGGLDDLFGMASAGGRLSLGKTKSDDE